MATETPGSVRTDHPNPDESLAFRVDEARCNRCGLCATDCPAGIITLAGDQVPRLLPDQESTCFRCQHCLAVCPTGALSIDGRDPAASQPLAEDLLPTLDQMDLLVRSRRSVRRYRDENVDPALVRRLLESLEYAPTGRNCRELKFTVIQDRAVMAGLRARTMAALVQALEAGRLEGNSAYLARMVTLWRDHGQDAIFRGAPHLLLVSTPPDSVTPLQDVPLTLAYFELLARSAGVGTLWLGLLTRVLDLLPELKAQLRLPAGHVYYAMLFGYPAVRYQRTVQRGQSAYLDRLEAFPV